MLVPATQSTGTRFFCSTSRTPICARPRTAAAKHQADARPGGRQPAPVPRQPTGRGMSGTDGAGQDGGMVSRREEKALPRQGFRFGVGGLLGADDFDVDAAIRLRAVDQGLGLGVALALVAGDRLLLALAFGGYAVGFDALGNQVFLDGGSALLGQLLVVASPPMRSVANGQDHFQLDGLGLGDQLVELGLAGRTQDSLVEVEQGVSSDGDLLPTASRSRGGASASRAAAFGSQVSFGSRSLSHTQPALSAAAAAGVQ